MSESKQVLNKNCFIYKVMIREKLAKIYNYENYRSWIITIHGANGTVFAGEKFTLEVKFTPRYPFEAPIVS